MKIKYNNSFFNKNILLSHIPFFFFNTKNNNNAYTSIFFKYLSSSSINELFFFKIPVYIFFLYFNNLITQKNTFSFFNKYLNNKKIKLHNEISQSLTKYKNFTTFLSTAFIKNPTQIFIKPKKTIFTNLNISFSSKFFFKNLYNTNKLKKLKRKFNYYKISKTDWFSDNMAILTRDTLHLNLNTYFKLKPFYVLNSKKLIITSLMLITSTADLFKEAPIFKFSKSRFRLTSRFNFFLINKYNSKLNKTNLTSSFLKYNTTKLYIFEKSNKDTLLNKHLIKTASHIPSTLESTIHILTNPITFKFFNFPLKNLNNLNNLNYFNINKNINDSFFYSMHDSIFKSNLLPTNFFSYYIKKKILKVFSYDRLPIISFIWHHHVLIRFLEFFTGKKICLKIFSYLQTSLNFNEKSQCLMWAQKLKYFRKVLGPKLFLTESLQIIYLSLKLKDPFLLSNWMVATMQKISFWKYKTFLRYLKYVLRYFFWITFKELNIKGIKFQLKGKVSVAGNARTRTVFHSVGFTSHATFHNKILYKLNLIKTFTGVLGFKLWIVF